MVADHRVDGYCVWLVWQQRELRISVPTRELVGRV